MTDDDLLPIAPGRAILIALRRCMRPGRGRAVATLVLLMVASSSTLFGTYLVGTIIDSITTQRDAGAVDRIGFTLVCAVILSAVTAFIGRAQLGRVVEPALARLRSEAFTAAVHLRLDVLERVGTADPLSRLTGDVGALTDAAHDVVPSTIVALLTTVLTVAALFAASPILGAAAMLGAPVFAIVVIWYIRNSPGPYRAERRAIADVSGLMFEAATGARTIRAFGRGPAWRQTAAALVEQQWETAWPPVRNRSILFPGATVALFVSLISVMVTGAVLYAHHGITIGIITAAALFVVQLSSPLTQIVDSLDSLQGASAAAARLVGITLATHDDGTIAHRVPQDGRVEVSDVHFGYVDDQEVLHGISFSVAAGERIAVVGPSGGGKSTIAKLIAGIHEPGHGHITVGGVPISEIAQTSSRRCVALVTQESHVFLGTVAENCRLGNVNATDTEVRAALESVHALGWVDALPQGMDTPVGSTGVPLTLVQTQQLALARVLLVDPRVVILDEATAALGTDAARGIERAFGAVLAGRTVITIAHRLDVVAISDHVLVVDHGRVDVGTHDDLLHRVPAYATLWDHWVARH